jgi:hypothetical protein
MASDAAIEGRQLDVNASALFVLEGRWQDLERAARHRNRPECITESSKGQAFVARSRYNTNYSLQERLVLSVQADDLRLRSKPAIGDPARPWNMRTHHA